MFAAHLAREQPRKQPRGRLSCTAPALRSAGLDSISKSPGEARGPIARGGPALCGFSLPTQNVCCGVNLLPSTTLCWGMSQMFIKLDPCIPGSESQRKNPPCSPGQPTRGHPLAGKRRGKTGNAALGAGCLRTASCVS